MKTVEIELTDEDQITLNLAVFASLSPAQKKRECARFFKDEDWSKDFRRRALYIYLQCEGNIKNVRIKDYEYKKGCLWG